MQSLFFSAPPFAGPRRHVRKSSVIRCDIAFPVRLRYARAGMTCGSTGFVPDMLVREPAHGMQALLEKQGDKHQDVPARSLRNSPSRSLLLERMQGNLTCPRLLASKAFFIIDRTSSFIVKFFCPVQSTWIFYGDGFLKNERNE